MFETALEWWHANSETLYTVANLMFIPAFLGAMYVMLKRQGKRFIGITRMPMQVAILIEATQVFTDPSHLGAVFNAVCVWIWADSYKDQIKAYHKAVAAEKAIKEAAP